MEKSSAFYSALKHRKENTYTQAYYRNGLSVREKRLKDAWYANNVTISLDVRILLKSFITVFKRENVYTNEAGTEKENLWIDVGE